MTQRQITGSSRRPASTAQMTTIAVVSRTAPPTARFAKAHPPATADNRATTDRTEARAPATARLDRASGQAAPSPAADPAATTAAAGSRASEAPVAAGPEAKTLAPAAAR